MLSDMEFTPAQAKNALCETVSSVLSTVRVYLIESLEGDDAELAVEWLFNHPDNTGEDERRF